MPLRWMAAVLPILLMGRLLAQETTPYFEYAFPDTLPQELRLDEQKLNDHILARGAAITPKGQERALTRFADSDSRGTRTLVSSGIAYPDWTELDDYLNEVMQQVLPDELKSDPFIHVYPMRRGHLNAYATASGQLFITIGLLANLPDEAALAAIFAHEGAHYARNHAIKEHLAAERDYKIHLYSTSGSSRKKRESDYSIMQEEEADEIAMRWLNRSAYDLKGMTSAYWLLKRQEINQLRKSYKIKFDRTTHPMLDERLMSLKRFMAHQDSVSGNKFVVDEKRFREFQTKARYETVRALLETRKYPNCIETAFRFHILEPENQHYLYFLMEAMRRAAYFQENFWDANFITCFYYQKHSGDPKESKKPMRQALFEEMDTEILAFSADQLRSIQARDYWEGEPPFQTNGQAYVYFSKQGEKLGCSECKLSTALSMKDRPHVQNALLTEYLKQEDIRHRDFARHLLSNQLEKALPPRKLFLFNRFEVDIYQGQEKVRVGVDGSKGIQPMDSIFASVSEMYSNREAVFMPELQYNQMADYIEFKRLRGLAGRVKIGWGFKLMDVELYMLDPKHWELFKRLGVNELEYLDCTYSEFRKREKTAEAFQEVKALDYPTILNATKLTRTLEVQVSSLGLVLSGARHLTHYSGELNLKFKSRGIDAIRPVILKSIAMKDEKEREFKAASLGQ